MKVRLLYFASLREQLGTAQEELELPAGVETLAALRATLEARGGKWASALAGKRVRMAVNQAMADGEMRVSDGDEIALFPPVTGG
jgi:sulfur-carrier protein